ncbi:MAG TPA: hypothetical protein VFV52_14470 [Bacilli bacterium]|nr:hypothetical protein [Bacilli bacterium]
MEFDIYAFADYSGAATPRAQRKSIVLATCEAGSEREMHLSHHSREELVAAVETLLATASQQGKRVLFGFDHSYSFPGGFYEAVTGEAWNSWEQVLNLLATGTDRLPRIEELTGRAFAKAVNDLFGEKWSWDGGGPFWGANFVQLKDPKFPYDELPLQERRLVEERCRRMKPIYKIGGAGSVGLQALYGIRYLARLRKFCQEQGIEVFAWPFDGWEVPQSGHVLVEVYPTLFNKQERTDTNDALACAAWLAQQDRQGTLREWFEIPLTVEERERARLEGWVIGVKE